MRMIGYYALHSFVNQIRKMCKTWVFVFFLICMLMGGLIGFGAAALSDAAGEDEIAEEYPGDGSEGEDAWDDSLTEEDGMLSEDQDTGWLAASGVEKNDIVELVIGGIILIVFLFEAVSADKNGSRIFLPADVNLLFAAPMKPQSVLMFRLAMQLGMAIFASIYLFMEIPLLTESLAIRWWASLVIVLAWGLMVMLGKLLQVLLYTVASTHTKLKKNLRNIIYLTVALIAGAWFVYWKVTGGSYLSACVSFFNGRGTRLIPIWGWMKGLCLYAIEGNLTGTLLCLAALLLTLPGLIYVIWHVKADFYEDAMAKSEETAAILEKAQAEQSGFTVTGKRKKDRSDRLLRDGMKHGSGASVFFHKSLYNRFRFAHLRFFTKTTEWYLVASFGVSALCRFVFEVDGLLPVALTLAVLVFFRTLGNPLEQDTGMDLFKMIPESTWAKLFWSLLGGTVNCLLDILPAMLVPVLLSGASPLLALAWIPFIVSIDFYATCVGTFINLSVPVAAGKMIKQLVQILFIYFGLLPDVAAVAIAIVCDATVVGVVGAALLNGLLGLIFFLLSPLFLEPGDGKKARKDAVYLPAEELPTARRHFSRLGFATAVILVLGSLAQIGAGAAVLRWAPQWLEIPAVSWIVTFAPLYLVAVPVGLLIMRKTPARQVQQVRWGFKKCLTAFIICIFMMYAGNLFGTLLSALIQAIRGSGVENPVQSLAMDDSLFWRVLVMVILAPMIEEYIFRKQLIDRMRPYGEKTAVITSAVMFGLFHGNLSQMFYAATIGLVFGYVYARTGRLRYSIGMHMTINLLGGVVSAELLKNLDFQVLDQLESAGADFGQIVSQSGVGGLMLYGVVMIGMAVAGLVLLCINSRKIRYRGMDRELPQGKRFKTVALNGGMILFFLACMALVAVSLA